MTAYESPSAILRRHGLHPKKQWGQNLLADPTVQESIADLVGPKPGETIVVLGVQRVRPGAEVIARPVGSSGSGAPAAPIPAANREQPSRSSLNVPQAIGSAQAAERK